MLSRIVMEWTKQHDRALLDEMTISDLFQYKKGTPERGQVWDSIAGNFNAIDYPKFKVAKRSYRDRWTLLCTKYKRRMLEEIQATGIDAEVGELDEIIEEDEKTLLLTVIKMERRKLKLIKRQQKKYRLRLWNGLETPAKEVERMERKKPKRKKGEVAVMQ